MAVLALPLSVGCDDPTSRSGELDNGIPYWGVWAYDGGEVEYVVVMGTTPPGRSVRVESGEPPEGLEPASEGLTVAKDALYWNGEAVDTSGNRRLFVLDLDGPHPVLLQDEDVPQLDWQRFAELPRSPLWERIARKR